MTAKRSGFEEFKKVFGDVNRARRRPYRPRKPKTDFASILAKFRAEHPQVSAEHVPESAVEQAFGDTAPAASPADPRERGCSHCRRIRPIECTHEIRNIAGGHRYICDDCRAYRKQHMAGVLRTRAAIAKDR